MATSLLLSRFHYICVSGPEKTQQLSQGDNSISAGPKASVVNVLVETA